MKDYPGCLYSRSQAPLRVGSPGRMACACVLHAVVPVFIRRVTARFRSKGSNGSNSHPKAGSSWPMACPYYVRAFAVTASEGRDNNLKVFQDFYLQAKTRIWPLLSDLPGSGVAYS